ncbi:MAG TPA: RDD family protein [Sedimentisphaerales bacterium]|nr:RDD family protein [Sedimentisphaerales bacterium]
MGNDVRQTAQDWAQAADADVTKAATEDWDDYSPSLQPLIQAEIHRRGLADKVFRLPFVCTECDANNLNCKTGRCSNCNAVPADFGYCKTCDRFFSVPAGRLCPTDGTKLSQKVASKLTRLTNDILDIIILRILAYPAGFVLGFTLAHYGFLKPEYIEEAGPVFGFLLGLALVFSYYFVFESSWQRTPAKFVTGTKVITADGRKPALSTIALRTLVRFVPFEALSFLSERAYGWHDKWSGTYVIRKARRRRTEVEAEKATAKVVTPEQALAASASIPVSEKVQVDHPGFDGPPPITTLLESEMAKDRGLRVRPVGHAEPSAKTSEAETRPTSIESQPLRQGRLEKCANCDALIGRLERSCSFKGHLICVECYQRLRKQERAF